MHVRHERRELLEKITDLPMQLVQKLQNQIYLDVYSSHHQATIFGKKSSNFTITPKSDLISLNIGSLSTEKYAYIYIINILSLYKLTNFCSFEFVL